MALGWSGTDGSPEEEIMATPASSLALIAWIGQCWKRTVVLGALLMVLLTGGWFAGRFRKRPKQSILFRGSEATTRGRHSAAVPYPLHSQIWVTIFWVGEAAGADHTYIANVESAWHHHRGAQ